MKKDKYDEISKEYRSLLKYSEEVAKAKKNLGYIDLEKPIHRGYDAEYVLREDVARREDAWLYQAILNDLGRKAWCKDKSFKRKYRKGKVEEIAPYVSKIYESQWQTFIPAAQKLFSVSSDIRDTPHPWKGKVYVAVFPHWFLKVKISKHYVTQYKEHDEVLEQEDAWIDDKLRDHKFDKLKGWGNYWTAPRWYRNHRNRTRRYQHKRELQKFVMSDKDPNFDDNYKDGAWYW